jgi:uncharacterized protein (DUF433 family)
MTQALPRITVDPSICQGKPCIRGMRYPVETALEWLAAGMDIGAILTDQPDLERDDILAALDFAARLVHTERIDLLAACRFSWTRNFHAECASVWPTTATRLACTPWPKPFRYSLVAGTAGAGVRQLPHG